MSKIECPICSRETSTSLYIDKNERVMACDLCIGDRETMLILADYHNRESGDAARYNLQSHLGDYDLTADDFVTTNTTGFVYRKLKGGELRNKYTEFFRKIDDSHKKESESNGK